MNRLLTLILIAAILPLLHGCKTTKGVAKELDYYRKPEMVIENVMDSALHFKAITLKASISISGQDQKTSFKTSMRMSRDSAIWASITFLGIAGAKTIITNDSVKMINYKDRNYVSTDFRNIVDLFNSNLINLKNLQAILLGNLVDVEDYQKLHLSVEDEQYVISTMSDRKASKDWIEKKLEKMDKKLEKQEDKDTEKAKERIERKYERRPDKFDGLEMDIWVDPETNKINKVSVTDHLLEGNFNVFYDDFRQTPAGRMPFKARLEIRASKNIDIDIVYSKVTLQDEVDMPFSIPDKYERKKL